MACNRKNRQGRAYFLLIISITATHLTRKADYIPISCRKVCTFSSFIVLRNISVPSCCPQSTPYPKLARRQNIPISGYRTDAHKEWNIGCCTGCIQRAEYLSRQSSPLLPSSALLYRVKTVSLLQSEVIVCNSSLPKRRSR